MKKGADAFGPFFRLWLGFLFDSLRADHDLVGAGRKLKLDPPLLILL